LAFALSFTPRPPLSATETRTLVPHQGSLFAGTGQWKETNPLTPPQIIRLDKPGGDWELEVEFPIDPVNRIAVACLSEIYFPTANQRTLICGFFGGSAVGVRNAPGQWSVTPIGDRRGQIRSFIAHKDYHTGVDMAFAGADQGIFSGVYDTDVPGTIQWATVPELDISGFPPMARGHPERVMSFAELRGVLYATIGQKIFRRNDNGGKATWAHMWTNPLPGISQSGLRGMTPVNGNLWVGVEGTCGRIVSVDATTWESATEIDLSGEHHFYVIVAYNNMCILPGPGLTLLAGLDGEETGPAHYLVLNDGAWRRFALPPLARNPMVSCRTICPSPFNGDVYFGGYDCNDKPARDTAWVVVAPIGEALVGATLSPHAHATAAKERAYR
jgi:hypothetical protein